MGVSAGVGCSSSVGHDVAYPFIRFPSLAEFIQKVQQGFGLTLDDE